MKTGKTRRQLDAERVARQDAVMEWRELGITRRVIAECAGVSIPRIAQIEARAHRDKRTTHFRRLRLARFM